MLFGKDAAVLKSVGRNRWFQKSDDDKKDQHGSADKANGTHTVIDRIGGQLGHTSFWDFGIRMFVSFCRFFIVNSSGDKCEKQIAAIMDHCQPGADIPGIQHGYGYRRKQKRRADIGAKCKESIPLGFGYDFFFT